MSRELGIFAADAPGCRALLSMVYEEFGCERAATPRKDDLYATFWLDIFFEDRKYNAEKQE